MVNLRVISFHGIASLTTSEFEDREHGRSFPHLDAGIQHVGLSWRMSAACKEEIAAYPLFDRSPTKIGFLITIPDRVDEILQREYAPINAHGATYFPVHLILELWCYADLSVPIS